MTMIVSKAHPMYLLAHIHNIQNLCSVPMLVVFFCYIFFILSAELRLWAAGRMNYVWHGINLAFQPAHMGKNIMLATEIKLLLCIFVCRCGNVPVNIIVRLPLTICRKKFSVVFFQLNKNDS